MSADPEAGMWIGIVFAVLVLGLVADDTRGDRTRVLGRRR